MDGGGREEEGELEHDSVFVLHFYGCVCSCDWSRTSLTQQACDAHTLPE